MWLVGDVVSLGGWRVGLGQCALKMQVVQFDTASILHQSSPTYGHVYGIVGMHPPAGLSLIVCQVASGRTVTKAHRRGAHDGSI
jgi:hypothetical protein